MHGLLFTVYRHDIYLFVFWGITPLGNDPEHSIHSAWGNDARFVCSLFHYFNSFADKEDIVSLARMGTVSRPACYSSEPILTCKVNPNIRL